MYLLDSNILYSVFFQKICFLKLHREARQQKLQQNYNTDFLTPKGVPYRTLEYGRFPCMNATILGLQVSQNWRRGES